MRKLSEMQERGIRRRLAMLIQRGRERDELSHKRRGSWQNQGASIGFDAPHQPGYSNPDTFYFLGRKMVVERKRQRRPVHISQIIEDLFHEADHVDAPQCLVVEIEARTGFKHERL